MVNNFMIYISCYEYYSFSAQQKKCMNIESYQKGLKNKIISTEVKSGCTRPPQSQSGAIFCHLNHHCVVFKSARHLTKMSR